MLLWHRPAAAALIQPLPGELPYDASVALKRKKKKKKERKKISAYHSQMINIPNEVLVEIDRINHAV